MHLDWVVLDRLAMVVALGLGVGLAVAQLVGLTPLAFDAAAYYWATPGDLYRYGWYFTGHEHAAYLYSPAFADALIPLRILPERVFTALWQLGLVAALVATIRGWAVVVLLVGFVGVLLDVPLVTIPLGDIAHGNIHVLLGAVSVFGLRYPALWSFALLSKITPAVGLVWFVARREWRNLAIALAVTGVITLASFAYSPRDWFAWATLLLDNTSTQFPLWVLPIPLFVRLPMAGALVWWGARTDRPWVVPLAVGFAIPMPYLSMAAVMICVLGARRTPQLHRSRSREAGC